MRRCIDSAVIKSDKFKEMPLSAQMLYIYLILEADNFGFLNNAKSTCEMIKGTPEDLNTLIEKGFLMPFANGVFCIRHWFLMNKKDKRLSATYGEYDLVTIKNNLYEYREDKAFPEEMDW